LFYFNSQKIKNTKILQNAKNNKDKIGLIFLSEQ